MKSFSILIFSILIQFFSFIVPAQASMTACFDEIRYDQRTSIWQEVRLYFASLSPNIERERSDVNELMLLRLELVKLQIQKGQLIGIVENHIRLSTNADLTDDYVNTTLIPGVLEEITRITNRLEKLAENGNLFAAQSAFSQLLLTLNAQRSIKVCELSQITNSPSLDKVQANLILTGLREEIMALAEAEQKLAAFIQQLL